MIRPLGELHNSRRYKCFFVSAVCVSVLKLVFHTAHISVVYLLLLKCSLNELECTPISSDVVSTVTLLEPKKHQLRALY